MPRLNRSAYLFAAAFVSCFTFQAYGAVEAKASASADSILNTRVGVNDHLIFSNAEDPNLPKSDRTSLFLHEMGVVGDYSPYNLGAHFSNRFTPDGDKKLNDPFILEKKT